MSLKFLWQKSITEINAENWNKNLSESYFLHRTEFLEVVEKSKINNAELLYFSAIENDEIIASAVISKFDFNLDLFIEQKKLVSFIKSIFPNIFNVKLLFCGTPISSGQSNFWVKEDKKQFLKPILKEIAKKMDEIAKNEKIKFLCFKEFDDQFSEEIRPFLETENYTKCWSLPTIDLKNKFKNSTEYFENLSSNQRRQIQKSLEKIGFKFENLSLNKISKKEIKFTISELNESDSKIFFEKYINVMNRASVKFETLNQIFFKNFFNHISEGKLLNLIHKNEIVSSFLSAELENRIVFLFVSKENFKDEFDSYFNLLTMLIKFTIEKKKPLVNLGQTTYYTKMRMGGKPENLFLFFKVRNRFLNRIFRKFNQSLFPKTTILSF